jgi:hypothetical protein
MKGRHAEHRVNKVTQNNAAQHAAKPELVNRALLSILCEFVCMFRLLLYAASMQIVFQSTITFTISPSAPSWSSWPWRYRCRNSPRLPWKAVRDRRTRGVV